MSAAEIIEMIKKLPAEEQERVRLYFEQAKEGPEGVRRMGFDRAMATGEKIFDRHSELFRRLAQ